MAPAALSVDPYFRQQVSEIPAPDADGGIALVGTAALNLYAQTADRLQPNRQRLQHNHCELKSVSHQSSYVDGYRGPMMKRNGTLSDRTFADSSADVQESQVAKQVSACLVVDFAHYKGTPKVIARLAGASPQAAKNWLAGDNPPSLVSFLRLLPHSPSLRKLVAMESELSPEFTRELSALIQRHMK
jgi:hypothetical protein